MLLLERPLQAKKTKVFSLEPKYLLIPTIKVSCPPNYIKIKIVITVVTVYIIYLSFSV